VVLAVAAARRRVAIAAARYSPRAAIAAAEFGCAGFARRFTAAVLIAAAGSSGFFLCHRFFSFEAFGI